MTEREWLICTHPRKMIDFLEVSARWIPNREDQEERRRQLEINLIHWIEACRYLVDPGKDPRFDEEGDAWQGKYAPLAARLITWADSMLPEHAHVDWVTRSRLLRDVVDPFYTKGLAPPDSLSLPEASTNQRGLLLTMLQDIRKERRWEELPILADLLEDGGCRDAYTLEHLRRKETLHCQGCLILRGIEQSLLAGRKRGLVV